MNRYERYVTFDGTTEPLFGKFSAHSLSARHDAIETYIRDGRPVEALLAEARHHIENAARNLRASASNADVNIVGEDLEEIHDVCLNAAHYVHSRLRPAFMAAGLAGYACYDDYAGYLAAEDRYLEKLLAIRAHWHAPSSPQDLNKSFDTTDITNEFADRYKTALTEFSDDLLPQLEKTLAALGVVE